MRRAAPIRMQPNLIQLSQPSVAYARTALRATKELVYVSVENETPAGHISHIIKAARIRAVDHSGLASRAGDRITGGRRCAIARNLSFSHCRAYERAARCADSGTNRSCDDGTAYRTRGGTSACGRAT